MLKRCLVTRRLPSLAQEALQRAPGLHIIQHESMDSPISRSQLLEHVEGVDGIMCLLTDRIDEEVLDAAGKQLKVVSTMSVGVDHIDVEACRRRGVRIGYTPGVLDRATAELAMTLLFATSRQVVASAESVKNGSWGPWSPLKYCGYDISGKTVGIIGLGRIGATFAHMLSGFDVRLLYTGPREKKEVGERVGATYTSMDVLLAESDIVSIHCPLNPHTSNLFNTSTFNKMKKGSILINTSRGGVVDQEALYEALLNGHIAAAGLDVTSPEPLPPAHKLLSLNNCTILPHIGSATFSTRNTMALLGVENLITGLEGRNMKHELL